MLGKTYQNTEIDTTRPTVPDTVNVALAEMAGELREGLLLSRSGPGCR